jgi:hypothetical protein
MSRSRGPWLTAWFVGLYLVSSSLCGIVPDASAQIYEAARQSLDLSPDPIGRAPRLLGMGHLTLVSMTNNRINLWDFGGNPTGVMDADSVSSFELRPGTASSSGLHRSPITGLERQDVASREIRVGYEGWRRSEGGAAYGFYGDASTLRSNGLASEDSELRREFRAPRIVAVLNGPMPSFHSDRLRYSLDFFYGLEDETDQYRRLFRNSSGDYLGQDTDLLPSPDFFTPDEFRVSTLGGGAGLAWVFGRTLTASVRGQASSSRIEGENSSVIHDMGTGEDRSYYTLQGTAVGRGLLVPGTGNMPLEWGYDIRSWTSSSESRWAFTLKAGINQEPFTGRGKLLDRTEDGIEHRVRARVWSGPFELNGSAHFWNDEAEITPPTDDPSSFNAFIGVASQRDGADTLALPDSIRYERTTDDGIRGAVGMTWKLGKGLLGMEYHRAERKLVQTSTGEGPLRQIWDVRTGFEYSCTSVFAGRLGYIYRSDDRDLNTGRNEFKSHVVTAGLGLSRPGSVWSVDVGWSIEWLRPDFDDATDPKESRQQLAAQFRWAI